MSLRLKNENVNITVKSAELSCEQKVNTEITLPDYCDDIKKILKCTVEPGIHTVNLSGERLSAKGTGTVRIIYLTEADKIDVYEKSCELSSSAELKQATPDTVVNAFSAVDFVNCRAVSQRRISVNASVSTIFVCFATGKESFALEDESSCVQVKNEKISVENSFGVFGKLFDMAETAALNAEHPPISKILAVKSRATDVSYKLSQGKLLIKGNAVTDICYIAEGGENELHSFSHSMPVNQIIDLNKAPDTAECRVRLRVSQCLCSCKADSSGSNRLADIALRVSAFVEVCEKKECEVITDCYCTDYEIEEKLGEPSFICPVREIKDTRQIKGEIELSSPIKEISYVVCNDTSKAVSYSESKAELGCSATVMVIYKDENGTPCCQEKNIDFELDYSIVKKCTEPAGDFVIECRSTSVNGINAGKAELTLDITVSGRVYCNYGGKILRELTVFEDKPVKSNQVALTLYFADKGELLWDIAKSHNSTVDMIVQENGIKGQSIAEEMQLLIPCV